MMDILSGSLREDLLSVLVDYMKVNNVIKFHKVFKIRRKTYSMHKYPLSQRWHWAVVSLFLGIETVSHDEFVMVVLSGTNSHLYNYVLNRLMLNGPFNALWME